LIRFETGVIPISAAIDRVDQCAAFFGVSPNALITTASTCRG
jgi:hypothetical protein